MLNKSRFSVKDLVNAGMFSALIIGVFWCCGMIGFIPVLMPFVPFLGAFCSAPVFMLYTSRIDKPGMIGILGCLFMLVFSLSGHGLFVIPVVIVLSIISEIILYTGKHKSIIHARLAYTVFMASSAGPLVPIYISRESYRQYLIASNYGADFADKMLAVMPMWSFFPIVLAGCLGAYLGTGLGVKCLNKHFKKAGMI